ncbi:MAG: hypothetical protein J7L96_04650 [Bacteroidales bacterium]|nr:hypothetical protein [Bacteroidales bacterium]
MTDGKRFFKQLFLIGLVWFTAGLLSSGSFAQDFTSSPYSRFGIGDLLSRNYGRGEAMGGLGIGLNSKEYLNLVNPAGLGEMDSLQFLFEVGGTNRLTRFSTTDLHKTAITLTFHIWDWDSL